MRRPWPFPPGEFPAAAVSRLSGWRVVQMRRLDLVLAIYTTAALAVRQQHWPQARQALTEAPRKRTYAREKFLRPLSQLLHRLRSAQKHRQGAPNDLF